MRKLLLLLCLLWPMTSPASPSSLKQGKALVRSLGCLNCHTTNGKASNGPTFLGLAGRTQQVFRDQSRTFVNVRVDRAYLRRALMLPGYEVPVAFKNAPMPRFRLSKQQEVAMLDYLVSLGSLKAPEKREASIWWLVLGAFLFVGTHLGMSSLSFRRWGIARWGNGRFLGLYSLVSFLTMGLMVWGWWVGPYIALWNAPLWTRWLPMFVVPPSFVLLAASMMAPNPTSSGQNSALKREDVAKGVLAITRHPMLWFFVLWGASHIPANGDAKSFVLFVSMIVLSVAGMLHIDFRRSTTDPKAWAVYAEKTSLLPFVAMIQGRSCFRLRELGWKPVAVGVFLTLLTLFTHQWTIGVSPWPAF